MSEPSFNLFLFGDDLLIKEVGVVIHDDKGTDEEKSAHLLTIAFDDAKKAKRRVLKEPIHWESYRGSCRMGRNLVVFEEMFIELQASAKPLVVITPIVDGVPRFDSVNVLADKSKQHDDVNTRERTANNMDWLAKYSENGGLDLPRLFNDDYFKAIKLLFNAGHVVSSAKLLLSFIDTAAFLDSGDAPGNFVSWLDRYAQLSSVNVTSAELWEFRNGLVHMTNISSRAVIKGAVAPLILFVGGPLGFAPPRTGAAKYVNYKALIDAINQAVLAWISTYNNERSKFDKFVERYDLVVSDTTLIVGCD